MASCPVCSAQISDDFGLVTCPQCGSQVLIDMEGQAERKLSDELSQVLVSEVHETPDIPPTFDIADAPVAEEFAASPATSPPATPDMSEIADYGNSEIAESQSGFLRFNVIISGIDTGDVRRDVLAALNDQRFLWDSEALAKTIRQGVLRLNELTAVKSAILIQRLRSVPVDIQWEQYSITQ